MIVTGEAQMVAGAKLDFAIEWADMLRSRTLSLASWATIAGLTTVSSSISGTQTVARLTSANVGAVYTPNVTATLSSGEKDTRGIRLQIVARIVVQDLARAVGAEFTVDALPWSDYLAGDAIASRSWSVGSGLTILSGGTTATPRIQATTAGRWYATEHIVTASAQEDERSILVVVRSV